MDKKNNSEQMENKKSASRYPMSKTDACDSATKQSDKKDGAPNENSHGHFPPIISDISEDENSESISDKSEDENSESIFDKFPDEYYKMFKNHQSSVEMFFNMSTKELEEYLKKTETESVHSILSSLSEKAHRPEQNVNETLQNVNETLQNVNETPQNVNETPQNVNETPQNVNETLLCLLCKKSFLLRDDIVQHVKTAHNVLPHKHLDPSVVAKVPSARNTDLPSPIALEREKFASEASRKLLAKAELLEADIRNTKNKISKKIMHLNFLSAMANAKRSCEMRGLRSKKIERDLTIFLYDKLMNSGSSLDVKLDSN